MLGYHVAMDNFPRQSLMEATEGGANWFHGLFYCFHPRQKVL